MVNERSNKQPALSKKKGPEQTYTKIASMNDTYKAGITELVKLAKDAVAKKASLGPEDVLKILDERLIPNAEELSQVANEIRDGLPGVEGGMSSGETEQKPTDSGNEGGEELDEDPEKRIANITSRLASLEKENRDLKVAKLAKEYSLVFPPHMRAAKEKEITDSDMDYELLHAKATGAIEVMRAAKESGSIKKTATFSQPLTASARTEPLPSYLR